MPKKNKPKVAIYFTLPEEEFKETKEEISESDLGFEAYFDLERTSPLDEFKEIAKTLNKNGFRAYTLNLQSSVYKLITNLEKEKP